MSILVTGATGQVGSAVARNLAAAGVATVAASRTSGADAVRLDFTDKSTWADAFAGVRAAFLVRPPALGNVRRDLLPALVAARTAGVQHVVFLSVQDVEKNPMLPHAAVERWLRASGMGWTFIRAGFFCQNLSTVHRSDIRERDEIVVPAGCGRTSFVDVHDVAAVAAAALLGPAEHAGRAWTVTGPGSLTYHEVAGILSKELGRTVRYGEPSAARYVRHARRHLAMPWPMVAVTSAIYARTRRGCADGVTNDVHRVLGRDPIEFSEFARRERAAWL